MSEINKIQKAWNLASKYHQNQFYTNNFGDRLPYINHIGAVVNELFFCLNQCKSSLDSELLIISGILHDTIEDTDLDYESIKNNFGLDIANSVLALTKDMSINNKVEQIKDTIKKINQQSTETALVKIADRIVNLQPPPIAWSKQKIEIYFSTSCLIYENFKNKNKFLSNRLLSKIIDYKKYL